MTCFLRSVRSHFGRPFLIAIAVDQRVLRDAALIAKPVGAKDT